MPKKQSRFFDMIKEPGLGNFRLAVEEHIGIRLTREQAIIMLAMIEIEELHYHLQQRILEDTKPQ